MASYINVRSIFVNESEGFADFVITLSAATPGGVTVTYSVSYVTAQFNDLTTTNGTLTFGAAETTKTLRVTIANDTASESHESVYLRLSNPVNAVIGTSNAVATIAGNDQTPGVPNASVIGTAVDEKAGTALFTVILDRPADSTVSLNWSTAGSSAVAGSDFGNASGVLTFTPGQTTKSFEVPITDDATAEGDELFLVNIASPNSSIVVAQGSAFGRIVANDAALSSNPVISAENAVASEADGFIDIVVRLSAPSNNEVRVTYDVQHTNTTTGDANTSLGGTLAFAPGETVKVLRVDIGDDTTFEPTESFYVRWTSPVNGVVAQTYTFGTILDNDSTAGTPLVGIRDVHVDEKHGTARFVVWLDKPSNEVVRVAWSTQDSTANAGSDYQGDSGTLAFQPGETVQIVEVAVFDDATAEAAERFAVQLADAVGAAIGQGRGWAQIAPSDLTAVSTPTVSVESAVVSESMGYVDIVVRLSAPSTQQVSVQLRDDYYGSLWQEYAYGYSTTLVFAPGEVEKTVRYIVHDDTESEAHHFFRPYLLTPVNAVLGNTYAMVTIAASDGASGTPIASVGDAIVDEKSGRVAVVIALDRPSVEPATVSWTAAQGSGNAVADADFRASSGTLTFAPGETSATVWVPIIDDADNENFETFSVSIGSPVGATIGRHTGSVLIGPSDGTLAANPVIRVHSTMLNEQDGWIDVMVVLSAPSSQQVTVLMRDFYNAASANSDDYSYSNSQTLTYAPGETTKVVRYHIIPDTEAEGPESWQVNLYTPTNAVIGTPYAAVTISRNNDATGTPVLSVHDVSVDEKTGLAQFNVTLDRPSTEIVVFNFAAANLSATDGDFVPVSGEMRLVPGQTSASIFVPLIDDALSESDELFTFTLSNLVNTTAGQTTATGRIVANDAANVATPVASVEHSLADEFRGYVDLVFRLSAPSGNQVSITWNDDYIAESWRDHYYTADGILIFAPGETAKVVRIAVYDDTASEPAESFFANITAATNAVIGNSRALVTLVASEGASGTPVVLVNEVAVDEKAGAATFFFALDRPSTETVSFAYDTQHISTALGDFGLRQGRLVFQPGQMLATLQVTISDDVTAEGDEFFNVVLSDPQGVQLSQNNVLARIGASDNTAVATPVVSVESTVVNEATGYIDVVVRLSAPSGQQVTVNYDDAYIGTTYLDYSNGESGSLIFAPGETLKTIRYAIHGDTDAEPAESFYVRIHTPTNAVIGNPYATVTIAPSDGTGTTTYLRVDDISVDEKAGSVSFVVSLSAPAAEIVSVGYASADGSAVASVEGVPGDYVAVSGRVSFAPGETTRRVTVPLNDDALDEAEELFFLDLSNATGATIAQSRGTARIGLSDGTLAATPAIRVESVVVNELAGFAEAVVKLSRPSAQQVSVAYTNSVENTSQSADYGTASTGTLVFAPGETIKTVRWSIADDVADEGHESFSIRLASPVNGTLGPANSFSWGYVTIAPSDGSGTGLPSASIRDVVVDEKDGTARFIVTLDRQATELLSFDWSTLSPGGAGSATADVDFGARSGTITFWPGETTRTITVTIADDAASEADESFNVILSAPVGGGIAQGLGTARIVANDQNAVATPQVFIESTTVYEQQGYADVVVRLSAPSNNLVTVNYADSYPTGVLNDYSYGNAGTLTFPAGTTVRTIRYAIVDDANSETSETFTVTLTAPTNATLSASPLTGTVTILDRDGGPVASITDATTGIALFGATVTYTIAFSQDVTGLALDDFNLVNVVGAQLSGAGTTYTLVAPTPAGAEGYQLVTLKIDAVTNGSGIGNLPAGGAQQIDTLVPVITGITPADEATGVHVASNIVVSFSQAVIFGAGSITLNGPGGLVQSFSVTNPGSALTLGEDGRSITLNPTNNLRYGNEYTLNIPAGALRDQAGNPVAAHTTHNFTTEPNVTPTAANGSNTTLEDTAVSGALPAYTDPNVGQPVIYGVVAQPGKGSVVANANGSYTYTPSLNSNGADSFSFFVRDDEGAQNIYTLSLTVTPVNDAPVAANGTAVFNEDTVFNGQLPAATDVDSTLLSYAKASNPAKGGVVVNANGSYTYTPNLNANGSDSFSYTVSDDAGGSNTYNVAVTINPVNDPPVGADGSVTVNEDQVFAGSLPNASDVDGDTLTFARVTQASNGTVTVNANGSYTYTPAANFSGSDSFSYSVSDGHGGSAAYSMGITVNSIQDTFNGSPGPDAMSGFAGADIYNGLGGNDTVTAGAGNDTVNGGDGLDFASYAERSAAINANLAAGTVSIGGETDLLSSIEALIGGAGDDVLSGNDADYNVFIGGPGADTISGGSNGATPGYNVDIVAYQDGTPVTASLASGSGTQGGFTDTLGAGIEALFGGSGADRLTGLDSPVAQRGETLRGGAGNDTLDGLGGVDTMEFSGLFSNYTVTRATPTATTITVTDNVGGEGVDTVHNGERIIFDNLLLGFGQRAEELARVSFVLWTPGIVGSATLYARGFSFYDNGYTFEFMSGVALMFHPEQGLAYAQKLVANMPGNTRTVDEIMTIMNNAGGGEAGRVAALLTMANDPATTAAIVASGIQTNGVVADLVAPGFGTLFGLLPGPG